MSTPSDGVRLGRAGQLLAAGHAAEAEQAARSVLSESPDSTEALGILAQSLSAQDRGKEAAEVAQRALALAPEDFSLGLSMCNALITAKRAREARSAASKLVHAHPHASAAHYTFARALLASPGERPAAALQAAQEARRLAPYDADVVNLCGVCHNALGESEWARSAYHAALAIDPGNAFAMSNLAAQDIGGLRLLRGGERLTSAMFTSPHSAVLQRQFARQLTRIGYWFFGLALVCLFAVFLLTFQPWWVHASVALVLTVVMVSLAVAVIRHLPRGPRNWAPLVWHHASLTARISLVVGVLLVVGMLAFGFGPTTALPSPAPAAASGTSDDHGVSVLPGLQLALVALVVGGRLLVSRRRRRRPYSDDEDS